MSSTRHSAHLRWSPLHPPLARFVPAHPQERATPADERGDGEAVLDLRESGERLAALKQG